MKDNNIGLVRLLGAFLVLAGHMYVLMGGTAPVILGAVLHRLGIIIFFLLGGYVITLSWERDRHYGRYMMKRFFRIIPALALYVFIAACVVGVLVSRLPVNEYFCHPQFKGYLKNIILNVNYVLPAVFENNPYPNVVNGSLWSLPIEVIMYLVVPCLYEINRQGGVKCSYTITLMICLLSIMHQIWFSEWHYVVYAIDLAQMIDIVPYYFIGCLVAVVKVDKRIFNLPVAFFLTFMIQCFCISSIPIQNIISFLGIPYIVFAICFAEPLVKQKWISKIEISYGIYLYGFLVQQVIIEQLYKKQIFLTVSQLLLICIIVTVILALFSMKACEKPIQKMVKKLLEQH